MANKLYEIRIHSRGGQGGKTLGQVLAEATIEDGKFTQAFSEYGPERSGAPMQVFVRISDSPIRRHSNVKNPDMVMVIDPTLMDVINPFDGLKENGIIIINSSRQKIDSCHFPRAKYRLFFIDATKIAQDILGKDVPNSALLGAFSKITGMVSEGAIREEIEEYFVRKKDETMAKKNLEVFDRGIKEIEEVKSSEILMADTCVKQAVKKNWKEIPPGGIITDAGNAVQFKTGGWKNQKPVTDMTKCIQCLRCFIFCPDSAVKTKDGKITHTDYDACKGCGICDKVCPVAAIKMERSQIEVRS